MSNEQPIQAKATDGVKFILNGWSKIIIIISVVKSVDFPGTITGILFSFGIGYLPIIHVYRNDPKLGTLLEKFIQALSSGQE